MAAPESAPETPPVDDPTESLTGIAHPDSRLERVLQYVPRALSSKAHVIGLAALGIYLVALPLLGVVVSSQAELIGGNYLNVTSDIGACIAAGGTLHLVRQGRRRHLLEQQRLRLTTEVHRLLHHAHPEVANRLGQDPHGGHVDPPAASADKVT